MCVCVYRSWLFCCECEILSMGNVERCGQAWECFTDTVNFYHLCSFSHSVSLIFFFSLASVWYFNCSRCWILSLLTEQITYSLCMSHDPLTRFDLNKLFRCLAWIKSIFCILTGLSNCNQIICKVNQNKMRKVQPASNLWQYSLCDVK